MNPFVTAEQVMTALGIVLLTIIMFMLAQFGKRMGAMETKLAEHQEKTGDARQALSAIQEGYRNTHYRLERIEQKLDTHLERHHP